MTDKSPVSRKLSLDATVRNPLPSQSAAARGLGAIFGLDPRAAVLTIAIDLLVFGIDSASVETLLPLGVAVAVVLGFVVYRIQRHWHNDTRESAMIKAMVVALLTALPVPITPLFSIPGGLLGIVSQWQRKSTLDR